MGMDRNRNRIKKIEGALTPKEIVALSIQELTKFDTPDHCASWIAEEPSRAPLDRMRQQVQNGVLQHQEGALKILPTNIHTPNSSVIN